MLTEDKVTEIFFMADEFCKFFDCLMKKYTIEAPSKRKYHRDGTLSKAEVMLILSLLLTFIGYWNENVELMLWTIYMYITYRQLFGYGWWGTLWRLTVILLLVITTMIVAVVIIGIVFDSDQYDAFFDILIVLVAAVVLETIMLYITHRINKRNYRKNNDFTCKVAEIS